MGTLETRRVLGTRVHATTYDQAADLVMRWAGSGESRYVCATSAHGVVQAYDDPAFQEVLDDADLITADGMPLVWALRLLGVPEAERVYGPTLTLAVLERASRDGVPVGFYGGTPAVLDGLLANLRRLFPSLRVVYRFSPPFRPTTDEEENAVRREIDRSGARIVFVGLGCPKQERWMARQRAGTRAVMIGVGAAFDFLAGAKRQAPGAVQAAGLEWLFRLAHEPRRLWRRYLYIVPKFAVLFAAQLIGRHPAPQPDQPRPRRDAGRVDGTE